MPTNGQTRRRWSMKSPSNKAPKNSQSKKLSRRATNNRRSNRLSLRATNNRNMSEEKQQQEEVTPPTEDLNSDPRIDEQSDERLDEQALAEILAEDQLIEDEFLTSGDEEEEADKIRISASNPPPESATE